MSSDDELMARWRRLTSTSTTRTTVQRSGYSQQQQQHHRVPSVCERQYQSQPVDRLRLEHLQLEQKQENQEMKQKKKKKRKNGRGNRKLQRYRAKLRKQGLNDAAIATMIANYNHSSLNLESPRQLPKSKSTKRKRETRPTTSVSQMSLANLSEKKRHRSKTMNNLTLHNNNSEQREEEDLQLEKKPKYLKVPDEVFKRMLSKSLVGAETMVQSLNTPEKLQFVRIYAHLLNDIFYLKLEENYLEHYEKVAMNEKIWSAPIMDRSMVRENNLVNIQFKTRAQLEQRQKKIRNQLQFIENKFNQHRQQQSPSSMTHGLDMSRIATLLPYFVRHGQHKLTKEFERKKQLLQLDMHEYQLVKNFYELKPTENQISSAKIIWQTTRDRLQVENELTILKQRILIKRLPSSYARLDHLANSIEQKLQQAILDDNKRTTLSCRRLKTIAQFKNDILTLEITTNEETIRSQTNMIANEKKKLAETAHGQIPLPRSLIELMDLVSERQNHMIRRNEIILQRQLSFFDDAPTIEQENTHGMMVVVGAK